MEEIRLLSREEKAKELNVSERTLDRWRDAGKVQIVKVRGSKRKWFLPSNNASTREIK